MNRGCRLAGRLGDGDGGGVGEPVRRADDEGLEGVARVQRAVRDAGGRARRCGRRVSTCQLWRLCRVSGHVVRRRSTARCRRGRGVPVATAALGAAESRDRRRGPGAGRSGAARRLRARASGSTLTASRTGLPSAVAEGVLDAGAQPALELVAGELVGHRHDRGALREHQRLAGGQPDALVGRQVVDDARATASRAGWRWWPWRAPAGGPVAAVARVARRCIHASSRSHPLCAAPAAARTVPVPPHLCPQVVQCRRMSRFGTPHALSTVVPSLPAGSPVRGL